MSLNIYLTREEVPKAMKIVDLNDDWFNFHTELKNSEFEKEVLMVIDKAKFLGSNSFVGRSDENTPINKNNLSTGTKTLLNIYNHKDVCFNTIECGYNALELLIKLKDGNVLYDRDMVFPPSISEGADIICRGHHFTDLIDFMQFIDEEA